MNLPLPHVERLSGTLGRILAGVLSVPLIACGADAVLDIAPGPREPACQSDELLGSFAVTLDDGFTSVQGKVESSPTPLRIAEVLETSGACQLMGPPELFCDPVCESGSTCGLEGACVPAPAGISIGTVTIDGLSSPIEMTANAPVYFYSHRGDLPHPGVAESDEIVLIASGEGDVEAFALGGVGIAPLESASDAIELAEGVEVALAWQAPTDANAGTIRIELNIAQHGGTPGWIECEVADTGSANIPMELTDALVRRGFSGFPSLTLERRSEDSEQLVTGCVEFLIVSRHTVEVSIPGLTSCSDSSECDEGQVCQADLTCG